MGEKPYYQAEQNHLGARFTDLEDAINEYGERREDAFGEKYDRGPDEHGHVEVEITSWARGPLCRIEEFDSDGETIHPTLGGSFVQAVVQAGYVPWGFRPESNGHEREHTGRWLWYLRPVEDVADDDSPVYETKYAIKHDDGTYLRNDDGDAITFERKANAEAVADQVQDDEVVEVPQ